MTKTILAAIFITLLTFIPEAASSFRYTPISYTPEQLNKLGLYLGGQIWQSEANGIFGEKNTLIDFNLKKHNKKTILLPLYTLSHCFLMHVFQVPRLIQRVKTL